jgi:serine/threonine protein kinase
MTIEILDSADQNNDNTQLFLPVGTKLNGYEIIDILGHGGFGVVYLALDPTLNTKRAIKEYLPTSISRRTQSHSIQCIETKNKSHYINGKKQFIHEAQSLAKINHPNIVKVIQCFEENDTAYIVMDFIDGPNLFEHFKSNTIEPSQTKTWLKSLLNGLSTIHAMGITHRDIKPQNILITKDLEPILIDFGGSQMLANDSNSAVISEPYSPMEQYAKAGEVQQGFFSDIYSLGQTFYQILTKKDPVSAPNRAQGITQPRLIDLSPKGYEKKWLIQLDRAIEPNWQDRHQDTQSWLDAIQDKSSNLNLWLSISLILIGIIGSTLAYFSFAKQDLSTHTQASQSKVTAPSDMILLAGGEVRLPRYIARIPQFAIDKMEVKTIDYNRWKGFDTASCPNCAIGLVKYSEALGYCASIGKRLPTEEEFVFAMQLVIETQNPKAIQINGSQAGIASTLPQTKEGLFDILGNVAEWTSTPSKGYTDSVDLNQHMIRGGSAFDPLEGTQGRFSPKDLGESPETYSHEAIGFRCAKSL